MSEQLRRAAGGVGVLGGNLWTLITNLIPLAAYADDIVTLVPLLKEWQAITDPISTATGLKARITVILKAANILAAATPNTTDDMLVTELGKLASNDSLIEFIAGFLASNPTATTPQLVAMLKSGPDADYAKSQFETANLDWNQLVQIIQAVMSLIEMIKNLLPATTPATGTTAPPAAGDKFGFSTEQK